MELESRKPRQLYAPLSNVPLSEFQAAALKIDTMPQDMSIRLLRMFCSHLDQTSVPSYGQENPHSFLNMPGGSESEERAFWALTSIQTLALSPVNFNWSSEYTDAVSDAWPGIFKWMSYFWASLGKEEEGGAEHGRKRQGMVVVLGGVLISGFMDERLLHTFSDTAGVLELAMRLWLAAEDVTSLPTSAQALSMLLNSPITDPLQRLLKAANGKDSRVGGVIVSRLRSSIRYPQINSIHVSSFMKLLRAMQMRVAIHERTLEHGGKHPIGVALLAADSVSVVTKTLVRLSTMELEEDNVILRTLEHGFAYVVAAFRDDEGFSLVAKSVNNGLLDAFVDCSSMLSQFSQDSRTAALCIIMDVLPRYLIYRTVLRAVRPSIARLQGPAVEAKMNNSIAKKQWHAFRIFALQRLYIRAAEKLEKTRRCENCGRSAKKSDLKRCDACHLITYCSRVCQQAAWTGKGHFIECQELRRVRRELGHDKLSQEDYAFFAAVMVRDAVRRLPELRIKASRKYPHTPKAGLWVKINYHAVPPTFDVFPLHDYKKILSRADGVLTNADDVLTDDDIKRIRRRRTTLIVGAISFGRYSGNKSCIMDSLLWDELKYERLDVMVRNARSIADDDESNRHPSESSGVWQCVGKKSEFRNPKLRERMMRLVEEERRWCDAVRGTWLTAHSIH